MVSLKKRKLFKFLRPKGETSVVKTPYDKFLNLFVKKGFKNRYIKFFYNLLRAHKKRVKFLCAWKYGSSSVNSVPSFLKLPKFSLFINNLFKLITLKLELKLRKFKRSEVLVPMPISPWRSLRLGLNLLIKNSKIRIQKVKVSRKNEALHRLLDEMWDTVNNKSLTSKSILDFTNKVLESSENFRSTQLFPVNLNRRKLFNEKKFISEPKVLLNFSLKNKKRSRKERFLNLLKETDKKKSKKFKIFLYKKIRLRSTEWRRRRRRRRLRLLLKKKGKAKVKKEKGKKKFNRFIKLKKRKISHLGRINVTNRYKKFRKFFFRVSRRFVNHKKLKRKRGNFNSLLKFLRKLRKKKKKLDYIKEKEEAKKKVQKMIEKRLGKDFFGKEKKEEEKKVLKMKDKKK